MLKRCDLHVQLEIIPGHNYPDEEELLNAGESVSRLSHLPLSTSQLSGAHSQCKYTGFCCSIFAKYLLCTSAKTIWNKI